MTKKSEIGKENEIGQLFDAVKRGATSEVEELFEKGLSPDSRDDMERTPLIEAAEAGNVDVMRTLLDQGADVNAVDVDGETALMAAAYSDHLDEVKVLHSNGADLEIRNNEGSTALKIAKDMGANAVAAYLAAQSASSADYSSTDKSSDSKEEGTTTESPSVASAAAAMLESPESQSYVKELDLELIPEPGRSAYFKPHKEPETSEKDSEDEAEEPSEDDGSDLAADARDTGPGEEERINRLHEGLIGRKTGERLTLPDKILAAHEERIVYDAFENKLVRSVNEKAKETVEKASLELGDHTVDTVFKGSYMAVLKPRSQEYKRFRKLWKHPDLIFDPRRWRDWTGGSAVRKYCLAEGIDVSSLRATHFVELYYVKDLKLILTLAEDASAYNYTVRQLKRAIDDLREHKDDHDPGKVIIKSLDQPVPLLEDPDLVELCKDKDRVLEELSKAERKKIRALIRACKPGLDEWKNLMDAFEGILSDLEDE